MSVTDPIADFLTRVRNAMRAGHKRVTVPSTRMRKEIARVLAENHYIRGFAEVQASPQNQLVIRLRYTPQQEPVITNIQRESRPGLRKYRDATGVRDLGRRLGTTVMSTSRGVMTDREAKELGIGGELLFRVW